jgi:hypothetical protein
MLFNFIGGGAPPAPGPVQSRLALSHLAIRFRVSPPFFPLSSSLHSHHLQRLSFIRNQTAQESLIPTHPSIPSCIVDLSIPVLA